MSLRWGYLFTEANLLCDAICFGGGGGGGGGGFNHGRINQ